MINSELFMNNFSNYVKKSFSTDHSNDPDWSRETIVLDGPKDQVDEVKRFLAWMSWCNLAGHSTEIKFYTDGDGSAKVRAYLDSYGNNNCLINKIKDTDKWVLIMNNYNEGRNDPSFSIGD